MPPKLPQPRRGSLLRKFNLLLISFYLGSLLLTIPAVYLVTQAQSHEAADRELSLLVGMVRALRGYVAEELRPTLMPQGIYHPPAVSSTVATSLVAQRFTQENPSYYIKVASDNPLNPRNQANTLEQQLLERFRGDRSLTELTERGVLNGERFLVSARPSVSVGECLTCHGTPEAAPQEVIEQYGSRSGFGYANNSVVGVMLVGVPLGNVQELVITRSVAVIGIITAIFTLFFFSANLLMRRLIITPLVNITKMAQSVSQGELGSRIEVKRNDEIGALAHAFELMRRSLVTMLKRQGGS